MLVFWKENLVFLAVPKTGTTSIEGALAPRATMVLRDPPLLKHSPIYRYNRFLLPLFAVAGDQKLDTLAVVRYPIDWLGSWYRYRHRDELVGNPNSTRGVSFDQFVDDYCRGKKPSHAQVGSQAKFLLSPEGEIGVDYLFRYEAQPALIAFLEQRLDTKIELPQRNISPKMDLELSAKTEAKLRRKCAVEFDVWESGQQ